jgi:hypothetical protein
VDAAFANRTWGDDVFTAFDAVSQDVMEFYRAVVPADDMGLEAIDYAVYLEAIRLWDMIPIVALDPLLDWLKARCDVIGFYHGPEDNTPGVDWATLGFRAKDGWQIWTPPHPEDGDGVD